MINLLALILFLFPLAYSPGPGNMFFAALAARAGFAATKPALVGYHVATLLMTILVGAGLLQALYQVPWLAQILGIFGSFYVLYLAMTFFTATTDGPAFGRPSTNAGFADGAMLLLLNPKAYLIMALMFTQFAPERFSLHAPLFGVLVISFLFTANNLIAFIIWAFAGDQLIKRFRTPAHQMKINQIFGSMLGVVGLWMLASNVLMT